jgi:hypothetical protein
MRYIPKPVYPAWTPDPDDWEAQIAEYRQRCEDWQIAQDMEAEAAKERRMNDTFDDDEQEKI